MERLAIAGRRESPVEAASGGDVEAYLGKVEWHRHEDGRGRLYRFGVIELTDRAGQQYVFGSGAGYRLVVLFGGDGPGRAYAFRAGDGKSRDFLSSHYVAEKLGEALSERDVVEFTQELGRVLRRPAG